MLPPSSLPGRRLAVILAVGALVYDAQAAEKITYDDHVFPIFESSCLNCHNPDKKKGDLDLSNYTGTMAGGSGGAIAEPGDGAGSKLYGCITHTVEPVMPPKGDKLGKKETDLIRAWIDGGLLENASSQAKKRSGPKIAKLDVDPSAKPEGPPPMPEHLNLEPVVTSARNTVVNDMACSPWAPLLAVTGQKQILLFNTDTLRLAAILPFPKGFPETVSFHPTGKYLTAGGGIAGKSGTTYTWDVTTGKMLMENGREFDSVLAASLRLDLGGVALGGPSRLIKLWDTQTGEEIKSIKKHTDWVTALAYSPDGILLTTGDRNGGAWVWEAHTGNEFHTLRGHNSGITAIAWRADSNIVGTASEDGQVIFWEMNNGGQVRKLTAHGGGTLSLDYARNGEFVTSGRNGEVKIWKADFNLKKALPKFSEMVVETAITHDGKRVFTADWNGTIEAWDANTFEKLGELEGTPPQIAERVVNIQKAIAESVAATKAARARFEDASRQVSATKSRLAEATAAVEAATKKISSLKAQKTQLDKAFTQGAENQAKLLADREARTTELNQARERIKTHEGSVARATAEVDKHDLAAALEKERNLAASAKMLRDQSSANPDHAELRQKADQAEATLAAYQSQVATLRSKRTDAQARLDELTAQGVGIASNHTASRQRLDEAAALLNAFNQEHKETAERRRQANQALQAASQALPQLQKAIKPAEDALTARSKELAEPQAQYEQAQAREQQLHADLKFWQAAEVNSRALVVTAEFDSLKIEQESDQATLETISRQTAEFSEELAQLESRKGTLAEELKKLSSQVSDLKASIDQRAPGLKELERQSKALQQQYKELSK